MTLPQDAILIQENGAAPIIGRSPAMKRAVALARKYAGTDLPILIVGPTGTGKELFARHIHAWSGRNGRLIPVNCGAIPRDLVEGLLFGRRRGAFTGAMDAPGFIEAARHGTLFLDELRSLPLEGQVKLLRVLESGEVCRLGDTAGRQVQFGVVAAAQADLREAVAAGAFRHDLYQRVAGGVVRLPALADRPEDIGLLALHFAALRGCGLGPGVGPLLDRHEWPGNVRELRMVVERAVCLSERAGVISAAAVAESIDCTALGVDERHKAADAAREELLATCDANDWRADRIARALGVGRSALFRRLQKHRISLRTQE